MSDSNRSRSCCTTTTCWSSPSPEREGGVDAQLATLLERIARASGVSSARELVEDEPESYEQRERAVRRDGDWRFRITAPPADRVVDLGLVRRRTAARRPGRLSAARHRVSRIRGAGADAARQCADLRAHVAAQTSGHGRVVVEAMADEVRAQIDAWGNPPPSLALMRTLKARFDPFGLCSPGRYVGGL